LSRKNTINKSPHLALLAIALLTGAVIGLLSSLRKISLTDFLPPLGILTTDIPADIFLRSVIYYGRFLPAVFICSIIQAGTLIIPAIIAFQGYSFSVGSAALFAAYAERYATEIIIAYGITISASVFCTFCMGITALLHKRSMHKNKFILFALLTVMIMLFSAFDIYFSAQIIEHLKI